MIGTIKWFDNEKGYGFISSEKGDIFVHYSNIKPNGSFKSLRAEQRVVFNIEKTNEKLKAVDVEPVDEFIF